VPSRHDAADTLRDILDNIERIESYRLGVDRKTLEANGQARDAIELCLALANQAEEWEWKEVEAKSDPEHSTKKCIFLRHGKRYVVTKTA
jgi:uncharacterized protein with HEPN domain